MKKLQGEVATVNTPDNQLYTIYEEYEKPTSTYGYSASPTSYYTTYSPSPNYLHFNNAYYHDVITKLKDCRYTFSDEDILQPPRTCFYKNHVASKTNPLNMSGATILLNQSHQYDLSIPSKRYKLFPKINHLFRNRLQNENGCK